MKKILFVGLVSVAALVGCNQADDLQVNNPLEEEMIPEEELYSDVPFNLSRVDFDSDTLDSSLTRSYIDTETFRGFDNVGLFCLAKRPINDGITELKNPSWSGKSSAAINQHSVWKKNVPVSVKYASATGVNIIWDTPMNPDYFPYYPAKDWFAYGFVAYHPRTENIVYTQTSVTAYIKLDGREKVLYSMAKDPKTKLKTESLNKLSFSKSFYNELDPSVFEPNSGAADFIYPYFHFETLTSTLNIFMWSKEEPQRNFHVEKVEFDNFPCIMYLGLARLLRLADKTAYDMKSAIVKNPFIKNDSVFDARNLSQFSDLTSWLGHFELYDSNGESISGQKNADGSYKYAITATKQKFGTIYIPPVYAGHTKANIRIFITIADDAGNKYKNVNPVVINAPTGGWTKGKSYDIPIWLNNPSEVAKDASLADWKVETTYDVDATGTNWEEVE